MFSLTSESDVAWALVESIGSRLTPAELNSAYVNLGISEFGGVIESLIAVVAREQLTVPDALLEQLDAWRALHHPDGPTSERLVRQLEGCRRKGQPGAAGEQTSRLEPCTDSTVGQSRPDVGITSREGN